MTCCIVCWRIHDDLFVTYISLLFDNIWNCHSPFEFVLKERWKLSEKK